MGVAAILVKWPKTIYSCIDFYSFSCLHPLSNERKSMFKSGDSRAVWTWVCTWKYLKSALHYLRDVIYGNIADQTDHFADVFVRENVAYGYDVMTTLWRSKVHIRRHFV